MSVKNEADSLANKLSAEIGDEKDAYCFLIPEWEPQQLDMAIRWLKSQIWEGFYVSYKVEPKNKTVYLKSWEGEEPDFNEVSYII